MSNPQPLAPLTHRILTDLNDPRKNVVYAVEKGSDLRIQIGVAASGRIASVANIASINYQVKAFGWGGVEPSENDPSVMLKTTGALDDSVTAATWKDKSAQHAVIDFSHNETGIAPGRYRLVIFAVTTDNPSKVHTLLVATLMVCEDGGGLETNAPPVGSAYYTAAQTDAQIANAGAALNQQAQDTLTAANAAKTAAQGSATAAAGSATAAAESAATAHGRATSATNSAAAAAASATAAGNAAAAAEPAIHAAEEAVSAADAAVAAAASSGLIAADFKKRYQGAFSVAPVAEAIGSLYYNTGDGTLYVWSGDIWSDPVSGMSQSEGDVRYPHKSNVFARGIVRGRARTPMPEQPGIEVDGDMGTLSLTETEYEALTVYEPRHYDVIGVGLYFGGTLLHYSNELYDASIGIHVAKTGNDATGDGSESAPYLTISKGFDTAVAANGGTVWVHEGVYAEDTGAGQFNKVNANPTNRVTVFGVPGEGAAVITNTTGSSVIVLAGTSGNVTFRNLTIRQSNPSGTSLHIAQGSANVSGIEFLECFFDGRQIAVQAAINYLDSGAGVRSDLRVKRCSFVSNSTGMRIDMLRCVGATIIGNRFKVSGSNNAASIRLHSGTSGRFDLSSNTISTGGGIGIGSTQAFLLPAEIHAHRNTITAGDGIRFLGGTDGNPCKLFAIRNTINAANYGILLGEHSDGGAVRNNHIYAVGDVAIGIPTDTGVSGPVTDYDVSHNYVRAVGSLTHGILLSRHGNRMTANYNIVDARDGGGYALTRKLINTLVASPNQKR